MAIFKVEVAEILSFVLEALPEIALIYQVEKRNRRTMLRKTVL